MSDRDGEIVDLVFALSGHSVADDYADLLWQGLRAHLPWLETDTGAAVHPLSRTSPGEGERYISKRSQLALRLERHRIAAARGLSGARLDLGGPVEVGAAGERELTAVKVLYSRFVQVGIADEVAFLAECRRQLGVLGIERAHLVAGKACSMRAGGQVVQGFSLMLHGLGAEDSLRLQRAGLGEDRKRGCGIFIQHKSVAAVGE